MLDDKNNNGVALLIADNKTDAVICENCHAKVSGSYCSQCGQSIESTIKYFWSVLLHLLDDIFSFDSRASRTLKPLLLKPGFLTQEYIQCGFIYSSVLFSSFHLIFSPLTVKISLYMSKEWLRL